MLANGVFKGGGAKGVAYAGALQACEEAGVRFAAVAGSSAGAITAVLVAAGFPAADIADLLPTAMQSIDRPARAALKFWRPSLLSNRELAGWLDGALARQVPSVDGRPTFADLHEVTQIELYVVAMDLGSRQPVVFSRSTSPDLPVSDAVVASAAIPVAFPPTRMSTGERVFRLIDGGVWANYPSFVFLDADFRVAHDLDDSARDRPTIGFVLDDGLADLPDMTTVVGAHGGPLDTDHGSAAREFGPMGALASSPLLRLVGVMIPALAFLIVLGWLRGQARDAFPLFDFLPSGLQDLAAIGAVALVALAGVAAVIISLVAMRFGRSAADGGLSGIVAAMGVGPGVPYWVGASSGTREPAEGPGFHEVVRIPVADELSTLSFAARVSVVNDAIRSGYESTWRRLALHSDGAASGSPIELAAVAPSIGDRVSDWYADSRVRFEGWWTRRLEDAKQKNPEWARRRAWMLEQGRLWRFVGAFFWLLFALAMTTGIVYLIELESERSARRWVQLVLIAPLFVVLLWRYAAARHRKASRPWTVLRRQRSIVLTVTAVVAVALAAVVVVLTVDRTLSISLVVTADRVPATIVAVSEDRTVGTVRLEENIGVPGGCGAAAGYQFDVAVPTRSSVGDDIQMRFVQDPCRIWTASGLSGQVRDAMMGYLVAIVLAMLAINSVLAIRWRHRYFADISG